jgi:DNA polymerase-3 subunit delta
VKISTDQVERELERGLASAWLVAGDEPLLVGEAADAVRARARRDGYTERELFFAERGFDWASLLESSLSLSLFAERRILEVKLPTAKPGAEGGRVLATLVNDPPPDTVLLVVAGKLERDAYSSAWFKAFEARGVVVQAWPVEIGRLPQWITTRAGRHGLKLDIEGARLLAERVEGNLLAAHQEIEKLALTHGRGAVSADEVAIAVANSARYDVFQLGEAALAGDAARALRILEGLRGEGTEPTLVLWAVCREVRALAHARTSPGQPQGYGRQAERRAALIAGATRRIAGRPLAPLLERAGRIDRQIKGLAAGDPWGELALLVATLAGAKLSAATAA